MKKLTLFFVILLIINDIFSQSELNNIIAQEEIIKNKFSKILELDNDSAKMKLNDEILRTMADLLVVTETFDYNFDSLKNFVFVLKSDNEKFKILTWGIQLQDLTYNYYGYIQYLPKKKEKIKLHKLTDKSSTITNPDKEELTCDRWYGAVYYELITHKHAKTTYYTLLGWDGNDEFSNKKIIEVLTYKNNFVFGHDFVLYEKKDNVEYEKKYKRVIFQYNKQAQMSLKYSETYKAIVYDHLSPSHPKYEGKYIYYGPDFSYDALRFSKGKWIHIPDVDVKNDY